MQVSVFVDGTDRLRPALFSIRCQRFEIAAGSSIESEPMLASYIPCRPEWKVSKYMGGFGRKMGENARNCSSERRSGAGVAVPTVSRVGLQDRPRTWWGKRKEFRCIYLFCCLCFDIFDYISPQSIELLFSKNIFPWFAGEYACVRILLLCKLVCGFLSWESRI